jgi:hypothetical protein
MTNPYKRRSLAVIITNFSLLTYVSMPGVASSTDAYNKWYTSTSKKMAAIL